MRWMGLEAMFKAFLAEAVNEPLFVFSPFITTSYAKELLQHQGEVHIVTSWRKDHLLAGVSDLELYNLVKQHPNWHLYINDRLHAKVYCRNFSTLLMGSANLTRWGMQDTEKSNHEIMVKTACDAESKQSMLSILQNSLVMNDDHFKAYQTWIASVEHTIQPVDTGSVVELTSNNELFLVSQLPASTSPYRLWSVLREDTQPDESWNEFGAAEHDINNLGMHVRHFSTYEEFKNALNHKVAEQRFFTAFMERIDTDGFRFGYGKEWVQTNCIDDPVPYRKDLTRTVQNLFAWVVALYPDEFEIIQPRHSQIIRRIAPQERNELCSQTGRRLNASWYIATNGYPASGIQYKSCPNCSLYAGELIFRLGRVSDGTSQQSSFGFTEKRINGNNPDGIHSWCLECRGTGDPATHTDRAYDVVELTQAQGGLVNISKKGA